MSDACLHLFSYPCKYLILRSDCTHDLLVSSHGLLAYRNISPSLSKKEVLVCSEESGLIIVYSIRVETCLDNRFHEGIGISHSLIEFHPHIIDL